MIKGALILGVGFFLGYTKKVAEHDDVHQELAEVIAELRRVLYQAQLGYVNVEVQEETPEGEKVS